MKRFARWLLFLLILAVGLCGLAVYWTFYRPLPDYEATLRLEGLREPVDVHWDTYGVPHIYAENEEDLWFALGYAHAQDRLWQMTLTQLAAEGRFAEFLGPELVPVDRLMRTIGFWRIAQRTEEQLGEGERAALQAYARGVNRYAEGNAKSLPIQFALADIKPLKWTPTHSLALARLMAWELNLAWKSEVANALLRQKLTPAQYADLFPEQEPPDGADTRVPAGPAETPADSTALADSAGTGAPGLASAEALLPMLEAGGRLRQLLGHAGKRVGSNAWAVDGSRTESGLPLLAGDPHLGLDIPGTWYEAHLNLDGRSLSGATLPGAPAVVLGQNEHLAWSLTNVMLDDTDFFVERLHPDDPGRYLADSADGEPVWEPITVQREVIHVKNADDTLFTRRLTRHGPVVSGLHPDSALAGDRVITMRWTGQEAGSELGALLDMGWATGREEFLQAARGFRVPAQNIIYADRDGNIGRYTLGAVPLRGGSPLAFRPGWEPELDWQGFVPWEELPREENPPSGWVANANNPIGGPGYPHYLTAYWEPGARYGRITRYLQASDTASSALFRTMQYDAYSSWSAEMVDYILPVLEGSGSGEFAVAISYLENWDYTYLPSETAASIVDLFALNFCRNVMADEMGESTYEAYIRFSGQPERALMRFVRRGSAFFDDVTTPQRETEREMILRSMRQTLQTLREEYGSEPVEWRWEQLHTLTLRPPLFGEAARDSSAPAALRLIVNNLMNKGPYPVRGHSMSLNNGEYRWTDPFEMVLGPSIRRIVDLSDTRRSLSILPTGQSGNPLSAYYGDQTEDWLNGEYRTFYHDSLLFLQTEVNTMRLLPANR